MTMPWIYDDGGRAAAGFRGNANDCGTRSIAIATGKLYREVYEALRVIEGTTVRNGTSRRTMHRYLKSLGFTWHATMTIGSGCTVHLASGELPDGRLVVSLSRHFAAVVDGAVRDTHDSGRNGRRCVYGYWMEP